MPTRNDLDHGLWFLNALLAQTRVEATALDVGTLALIEELTASGRLDPEALATRFAAAEATERLRLEESAHVQLRQVPDKYTMTDLPQIDCGALLPLCRGRCCGLLFPLSLQDVDEGIVAWDVARPYLTRQRDGRCVHQSRTECTCEIHQRRPAACRSYDCRADKRIWLDFERRIPAPGGDP